MERVFQSFDGTMALRRLTLQLTFFITAAIPIYMYIKFCQIKAKMNRPEAVPGFPSRPNPHWLVGHLMVLRGTEIQVVEKTRSVNGDKESTRVSSNLVRGYQRIYCDHADPVTGMGSFWFFHIPCVSFLRGRDAKKILCSSSYRKSTWFVNIHTREFLGPNTLLQIMGREWRFYRNAVHKSFTSDVVKESRPFMYQVGNTLAHSLLAKVNTTELVFTEVETESFSEDDSDSETIPVSSPSPSLNEVGPPIAILPLMKMATIDVFGIIALRSNGVDFGCTRNLELTPLASAFDHLTTDYTSRLKRPWDPLSFLYSIPTKANRNYHQKRRMIREFISEQIAKTRDRCRSQQHDTQNEKSDMLTNLIMAADSERSTAKHDSKMSKEANDEALGDILMTLLFAGYDTTSIALSYALYLLAKNPTKRAKCLAEIDTVFGSDAHYGEVNTELPGPEELPYTKAVVLESLRLFPPAPSTYRTIETPVTLNTLSSDRKNKTKVTLEEGQMVMLPIWSIQRSEFNYPRPNEMIPERWVRRKKSKHSCSANDANTQCGAPETSLWEGRPENESREEISHRRNEDDADSDELIPPANRDAFLPFAAGARNCVGKNLALEESVILLACLLHKLSFDLVSETYEVSPSMHAVVQKPEDDLPMIVRPRR